MNRSLLSLLLLISFTFGIIFSGCTLWIFHNKQQQYVLPWNERNDVSSSRIASRERRITMESTIFDANTASGMKTMGYYNTPGTAGSDNKAQQQQQSSEMPRMEPIMNGFGIKSDEKSHAICQAISSNLIKNMGGGDGSTTNYNNIPHSTSIWSYYAPSIFKASQFHNFDINHVYHDFIVELMKFITPSRLATSRRALPFSQWDDVDRIIKVIYERYMYVNYIIKNPNHHIDPNDIIPRKLHIVVFGGSVTEGKNCTDTPINTSEEHKKQFPNMMYDICSWPTRLEQFLNHLLIPIELREHYNNQQQIIDMDIVRVHNLAAPATSTPFAELRWDLSLVDDDVPLDPDIIISSYSTNDYFIYSTMADNSDNKYKNPEEAALHSIQDFIHTIFRISDRYTDPTCKNLQLKKKPLLLFYDDFIKGHSISDRYYLRKVTDMIVNYYGLGYMSYSDAIIDLVYPDTNEAWFTGPPNNVHPGLGMHITSTWVIAYNLLEYVTTYCGTILDNNNEHYNKRIPALHNDYKYPYRNVPKKRPSVLPPYITDDVTFSNIHVLWNQAEYNNQFNKIDESLSICQRQQHDIINQKKTRSCFYSTYPMKNDWRNVTKLAYTMNEYMTYNNGWDVAFDYKKLGFVPTSGINSTFVLTFPNLTVPIKSLHIYYMQSYGNRWIDSIVDMTLIIKTKLYGTYTSMYKYNGSHNQETSTVSQVRVPIQGVDVGDEIQIQFQLVSGQTFKIMALLLCYH